MDISVLTEQRREMVINLLKGMKIRKSDGEGFDKDDVYACMQQLCDVYEKSIDDLTVSYETEIGELQDKYQKYDENNDLYISLIMEAKKSSNEIINKAKSEVDEILAAGKEQIAAQEEEIERVRAAAAQEKADLDADLETARAEAAREKADLAASVETEKQQVAAVREQYRDQIAVMDQEFDEIKTNILRTAGKIDGLRAQLEEAGEEASWQLQDEPAELPAAEESEPAPAPEEMTFEQLVSKLQEEDAAKAGQVAEVGAPAETLVVEPEIEVPAAEAETEGFHFEPVFDIPAAAPEVEIPAAAAEEPAIEIPAEPVQEPVMEGPFEEPALDIPDTEVVAQEPAEEPPADIPLDISFEEPPQFEELAESVQPEETDIDALAAAIPTEAAAEAAPAELNLDSIVEEAREGIAPDAFSLDSVVEEARTQVEETGLGSIEDLALEEISVDLPEEAAEEPIEEISFEGLEELFKE